jgi:EAL domain-containing protein (putative c-di-GMP-specific phosphodiesterase class I)
MLEAALSAAADARQQGPGTIRAFSRRERRPRVLPSGLIDEVGAALENGQIQAWFQPQLSTDTGKVTGFEALARWQHPVHGGIAPAEFLGAVAAAGRTDRLGQVILHKALTAMRDWIEAGSAVPTVAVALTEEDLRDPTLPERIKWELDRFDLAPERLSIEIRQSAIQPGEDDMLARNVAALAELGLGIDLGDFGTGSASIATIRRFAVDRIKIDRSFVARIDTERDQQDMVAAILSMAERLGLSTLAEGVETLGEHAMLAQLGCATVQGLGISPPLPFDQTEDWMRRHAARIADTPRVGRRVM